MEKPLKFVGLLSLEKIALRRVSVLLCSNSDSTASFWQTYGKWASPTDTKDWQNVVEAKMVELELPESLKKQIIDYVPSIGFEIKKWIGMHAPRFDLTVDEIRSIDPSKLCWTAAGAIDDRKTAEQILSCHLHSVEQRYKIACFYCLENYVPLWEDLHKHRRYRLSMYCLSHREEQYLEFYWLHVLKGEQSQLDFLWRGSTRNLTSSHQWFFEEAAKRRNQSASEYFFHLLTPAERETSLMRSVLFVLGDPNDTFFINFEAHSDLLCYLLSLLTPEQQMEIVRTRPVQVLLCFLDWNRLHLFSENAGLIWPFITPDSYDRLLWLMTRILEMKNRYFTRSLQELLRHCPLDFKKYFVEKERDPEPRLFFYRFMCFNDSESLRAMFACLDAADRTKIVLNDHILVAFRLCLSRDKWQVVEVCLREAALSKEDRQGLREGFTRFLGEEDAGERKFRRFFQLLDALDGPQKSRKRKLES